jgi:NADH:ubiquinone oxidoreductase subunit 6 (subunit J)
MIRNAASFLAANLGLVFFWILVAGVLVAYIAGRPQSSHPSKPWLSESGETTWVGRRMGPRTRVSNSARTIAFAGSALLLLGVLMLIRSPTDILVPGPPLIFVLCALASAFYAAKGRLRSLYLTGGISLAFLLLIGFVSMSDPRATADSPMSWSWLIILAAAVTLFVAASMGKPVPSPTEPPLPPTTSR